MKKIFALMLIAFFAVSFAVAQPDYEVADDTNYKLQFGAGLTYDNEDGYDQPTDNFEFEFILPVHEKVRIGLHGDFNDVLSAYDSTTNKHDVNNPTREPVEGDETATSKIEYWSALNNYARLCIGVPVIEDKLSIGLYVGGGNDLAERVTDLETGEDWEVGHGLIDFGLGIFLKSELFGGKLSSLSIKYDGKGMFMGTGLGINDTTGATKLLTVMMVPDEDWVDDDNTNYDFMRSSQRADRMNLTYTGYWNELSIGLAVPIHELAGFTNITKFEYGMEIEAEMSYYSYSSATKNEEEIFVVKPTYILGGISFENYLAIAPDSSTEFKLTIDPNCTLGQVKYTVRDDDTAIDFFDDYGLYKYWEDTASGDDFYGFEYYSMNLSIDFTIWGKKSFELGAALGIIPFFEIDASWELAYNNLDVSNGEYVDSRYTFNSGSFSVDPGIKLGLQFGNWETSIKWDPSATYGLSGNTAANVASASNIWNLANWNFSISCTFPPPEN